VSRVDRRGIGFGPDIRAAGDVAHKAGIKQPLGPVTAQRRELGRRIGRA
jgi:hypothetical protein